MFDPLEWLFQNVWEIRSRNDYLGYDNVSRKYTESEQICGDKQQTKSTNYN